MPELEPYYTGEAVPAADMPPRQPLHVVLDNLRSAFNVGSIFRTADACAVAHMHLCGMTAHPPHPKLEKTALGAFDYLKWSYYERNRDCVAELAARGIPLVAVETVPEAVPHHIYRWPKPVAVVFGNEVNGVNERVLRRCDAVVRIPMLGHKNSLNVATAVGVVLYEILRQWDGLDGPQSSEENLTPPPNL